MKPFAEITVALACLGAACATTFEGQRPERPDVWISAVGRFALTAPSGFAFVRAIRDPYRLDLRTDDGRLDASLEVLSRDGEPDCQALLEQWLARHAGADVISRGRLMIRGLAGAFVQFRAGAGVIGLAVINGRTRDHVVTVRGPADESDRVALALQDLAGGLRPES